MAAPIKEKDQKILNEMKTKIQSLPLAERITAVAIYRLTEKYFTDLAQEEAKEEKLDQEYKVVEKEVLAQSTAIITGARAASQQELEHVQTFLKEGETADPAHNVAKPVEGYWAQVFKNSSIYSGEADEAIFKYVTSVNVETNTINENNKTASAVFKIAPNEFFDNTELKVEVTFEGEMPKKSVGTKINWKAGKDITKKNVKKTQKNKKTGAKRTVEKEIKAKTFFGLFADFTDKDAEEEAQNEDEEEQPNIFILAETLDHLADVVPFSLEYYLGVVEDEDGDFEDEDEDDDEEDEAPKSKLMILPKNLPRRRRHQRKEAMPPSKKSARSSKCN